VRASVLPEAVPRGGGVAALQPAPARLPARPAFRACFCLYYVCFVTFREMFAAPRCPPRPFSPVQVWAVGVFTCRAKQCVARASQRTTKAAYIHELP